MYRGDEEGKLLIVWSLVLHGGDRKVSLDRAKRAKILLSYRNLGLVTEQVTSHFARLTRLMTSSTSRTNELTN
jgi:hypothetical protein